MKGRFEGWLRNIESCSHSYTNRGSVRKKTRRTGGNATSDGLSANLTFQRIIRNQLAALDSLQERVMEFPRHASAFRQSLIEQDPPQLLPRIALFGI
jgi:hypothetical protein